MKSKVWVELVDNDGEVEVHNTATRALESISENGMDNYQEIWAVSQEDELEITLENLSLEAEHEKESSYFEINNA